VYCFPKIDHAASKNGQKMITINETFRHNLKVIMERQQLGQESLAEICGYHQPKINRMLNGAQGLTLEDVEHIAQCLGVACKRLLDPAEVHQKLTHIEPVDRAIEQINTHLYRGKTGQKKIQHYFADDYHLVYAEKDLDDEQRVGPSFVQEIEVNKRDYENFNNRVNSAWIMRPLVMSHITVTISLDNDKKNKDKDTTTTANLYHADASYYRAEVLDSWQLTHSLDAIIENNKPVKIKRRTLKWLTESYV